MPKPSIPFGSMQNVLFISMVKGLFSFNAKQSLHLPKNYDLNDSASPKIIIKMYFNFYSESFKGFHLIPCKSGFE